MLNCSGEYLIVYESIRIAAKHTYAKKVIIYTF